MAFKLGDRIRETSTTTGTGSLTLAGAVTGFATFASVLSTGDTTWYAIVLGANWEVGLGTFTSPGTLARTAVLSSSNAGAAVSFAAGDKDVFITTPAAALAGFVRSDGAQSLTTGQKLQARQNAGISTAGDVLASAADVAAQRTHLGIKWPTVFDQTVSGAAVQAFDVSLASFSLFKINLLLCPGSGVDPDVRWQVSYNGTTFDNAGTDYDWEVLQGFNGTVIEAAGQSNSGYISGPVESTASTVPALLDATFFKGAAALRASMKADGFSSSASGAYNSRTLWGGARRISGTALILRILCNTNVAGFGVGTRLIVEGS